MARISHLNASMRARLGREAYAATQMAYQGVPARLVSFKRHRPGKGYNPAISGPKKRADKGLRDFTNWLDEPV